MSNDETTEIDGKEVQKVAESDREAVEVYLDGESLVLTTEAVREGGADGIRISLDELKNLLVDVESEVRDRAE